MNNIRTKRIQQPLTQAQIKRMAKANEGFIDVIVTIELDTLISVDSIDEFNNLIDSLVVGEDSWASLG